MAGELQKALDSEYNRAIEDASKFVEELNALSTGYIAVEILKLRRV